MMYYFMDAFLNPFNFFSWASPSGAFGPKIECIKNVTLFIPKTYVIYDVAPMATTESDMLRKVGLKPESDIFLASVLKTIVERAPPLL